MTPAQRAALDGAKAKLREAQKALRDAGLRIPGETGRVCLIAADEAFDSLDAIEDAQRDDHEDVAEWLDHNPMLPLEMHP